MAGYLVIQYNGTGKKEYCIPIIFPNDNRMLEPFYGKGIRSVKNARIIRSANGNEAPLCSPPPPVFENPRQSPVAEFNLTGNVKSDTPNFSVASKYLDSFSVKGSHFGYKKRGYIHFRLSGNAKYWELIKLLDLCIIKQMKFYIVHDYDVFILNELAQKIE